MAIVPLCNMHSSLFSQFCVLPLLAVGQTDRCSAKGAQVQCDARPCPQSPASASQSAQQDLTARHLRCALGKVARRSSSNDQRHRTRWRGVRRDLFAVRAPEAQGGRGDGDPERRHRWYGDMGRRDSSPRLAGRPFGCAWTRAVAGKLPGKACLPRLLVAFRLLVCVLAQGLYGSKGQTTTRRWVPQPLPARFAGELLLHPTSPPHLLTPTPHLHSPPPLPTSTPHLYSSPLLLTSTPHPSSPHSTLTPLPTSLLACCPPERLRGRWKQLQTHNPSGLGNGRGVCGLVNAHQMGAVRSFDPDGTQV